MNEQQQKSQPKALPPEESKRIVSKLFPIFKKWLKRKKLKPTPREEANQENLTSVGVTEDKSSKTPSEDVRHSRTEHTIDLLELFHKMEEDELVAMEEAKNPEIGEVGKSVEHVRGAFSNPESSLNIPEEKLGEVPNQRSGEAEDLVALIDKIIADEIAAMEAVNPETKESHLAVRLEKEATAKELTTDFGELAEYKTMNRQEQTEEIAGLRKKLEEVEKRLEITEKKLAEYQAKKEEQQAGKAKRPKEKKKVLGAKNKIVTLEEYQRIREELRQHVKMPE